jgi:hypothetical protein
MYEVDDLLGGYEHEALVDQIKVYRDSRTMDIIRMIFQFFGL